MAATSQPANKATVSPFAPAVIVSSTEQLGVNAFPDDDASSETAESFLFNSAVASNDVIKDDIGESLRLDNGIHKSYDSKTKIDDNLNLSVDLGILSDPIDSSFDRRSRGLVSESCAEACPKMIDVSFTGFYMKYHLDEMIHICFGKNIFSSVSESNENLYLDRYQEQLATKNHNDIYDDYLYPPDFFCPVECKYHQLCKIDINCWGVSRVSDFDWAFHGKNLNDHSLDCWDVKSATSMVSTFRSSTFNGDISHWDVSKVMNMDYMFAGSTFNQKIDQWDISSLYSATSMFQGASEFNQCLGSWSSKIDLISAENMFLNSGCSSQADPGPTGPWCQSNDDGTGCPLGKKEARKKKRKARAKLRKIAKLATVAPVTP